MKKIMNLIYKYYLNRMNLNKIHKNHPIWHKMIFIKSKGNNIEAKVDTANLINVIELKILQVHYLSKITKDLTQQKITKKNLNIRKN